MATYTVSWNCEEFPEDRMANFSSIVEAPYPDENYDPAYRTVVDIWRNKGQEERLALTKGDTLIFLRTAGSAWLRGMIGYGKIVQPNVESKIGEFSTIVIYDRLRVQGIVGMDELAELGITREKRQANFWTDFGDGAFEQAVALFEERCPAE